MDKKTRMIRVANTLELAPFIPQPKEPRLAEIWTLGRRMGAKLARQRAQAIREGFHARLTAKPWEKRPPMFAYEAIGWEMAQ